MVLSQLEFYSIDNYVVIGGKCLYLEADLALFSKI